MENIKSAIVFRSFREQWPYFQKTVPNLNFDFQLVRLLGACFCKALSEKKFTHSFKSNGKTILTAH